MTRANALRVKIFADGAEIERMVDMAKNPLIKGFPTNPTLMRKASVQDYAAFARAVLARIPDKPVSFEVFSDDFDGMARQAREIAGWGDNVYVKIPVTNTLGEFAGPLVRDLAHAGVKVNVTAILTVDQVARVAECLAPRVPSYVSVFAGRIADTGRDPIPAMTDALKLLARHPRAELIWASPRELLNIVQAHEIGCHVITVTNDLLAKLPLLGKDLDEFSLETVQMFREDALKAGFTIDA